MTAAEHLREMLDENGIEHHDYDKAGRTQTMWESPDGRRHFAYETFDNQAKTAKLTISWFPTPEQAIEATLGRRTCEVEGFDDGMDEGMDGRWYAYSPPHVAPLVRPHVRGF